MPPDVISALLVVLVADACYFLFSGAFFSRCLFSSPICTLSAGSFIFFLFSEPHARLGTDPIGINVRTTRKLVLLGKHTFLTSILKL